MKFIKLLSLPLVFMLTFSLLASVFPQITYASAITTKSIDLKSFSSGHQRNDSEIVPGQVIVKYKHLAKSNASFGAKSIGLQTQTLYFSKDISVSEKIAQLEQDPNVEYAEPNYRVHIAIVPTPSPSPTDGSITSNVYFSNDLSYMHNWGKTVTKLTYAQGLTSPTLAGQVIVAVVDTGVYMNHPDLVGAKIPGLAGRDFVNNDNDPQDDEGHGTNVAGIIAANGSTFLGVAPGTKILPVKVLNQDGSGFTSDVIAGINYAVENGADIINLSLASPDYSQALHEAVISAVKTGVLVVAAAGNAGNNYYGGSGDISNDPFFDGDKYAAYTEFPAALPEVISVGAAEQLSNGNIVIADFSNVGKIDVVAPGVNIYSTYNDSAPNNYRYMSGTSQATPIVVGFAALLKANNMDLDVESLTRIIKDSATPYDITDVAYPNINFTLTSADIYGSGLIDGKSAFQQPRLDFNAVGTKFDNSHHITINVSAKDYKGNPDLVNGSVIGYLYQIYEDDFDSFFNQASSSTILLVNGVGQYNILNPSYLNSKFYHYFLYLDDALENHDYIYSKGIELINKPSLPTPNQSGTFTGAQQITLKSTASNSIYYSLNDWASVQHYTGSFTISSSSTLRTYSLENHVYSDEGAFNYVINSITTDNSGSTPPINDCGACGFVPFIPPGLVGSPSPTPTATPTPKPSENVITKNDDGKNNLEVKPNKDYLLDLLNKSKDDVLIDARSTESLHAVSVELDGNVLLKAKEKGTPIIIQSNDLQIHFTPDTLNLGDSTSNVKFSATVVDDQALPTNIQSVSGIYDFNLSVDDVDKHEFNKPIEVHFSIDPAKIHKLNNLGVFYYNESNQKWEYVGGTVNKDNTVTALLPHFSKYAVLEYNKTFNDIQVHWAKAEIEEMASKQIISGMTEQTFEPQLNITRAQFVSLLARALKLDSAANHPDFSDVPAAAWYNKDVYAAFNANVIKGVTESIFAPEDKITREQLATLLVNAYLQKTGKQLSDIVTTQEVKYSDEGSISSWARSNVRIATSLGLMSGLGDGTFSPRGFATRAEAAVVLQRFLNKTN